MARKPPPVRLRRLGAQLRKIREEAGLTLDEAALLVQHSKSTLSRIENAQLTPRAADVGYLLWKYGVTDEQLTHSLISLAQAGRQKGWWRAFGTEMSLRAADWISLEQDSSEIHDFQLAVVPGLLQTAEYARALMLGVPRPPSSDIDRAVALRTARQQVLTRPDPTVLHAVLDEGVIRRGTGGAEVMRAQLQRLLDTSELEHVTVQILPLSTEMHPGIDGAFVIAKVNGGNFSIVFSESLSRGTFVEDDTEVDRYIEVFERLQSLALTEPESLTLIERVLHEL